MSLRARVELAKAALRLVPAVLATVGGAQFGHPVLGLLAGAVWFAYGGPVLREILLPRLFPEVGCPGCGRTLPLTARWRCAGHYTDHRERHVLAFLCPEGHRLSGFDCPRCGATILLQRGDRQRLRGGTPLRLLLGLTPEAAGEGSLLLGHDRRGKAVFLPPEQLAWHVAITGGTGRGKSTLLANLIRQLIAAGEGLTVLDPGGDLAGTVRRLVPPERERDLLFLDVGNRASPFPMNVLAARDEVERAVLCEELLGVFERLHADSWGPMLAYQLRMALRAASAAGGTLRDVYGLFVDDAVRERIIVRLADPVLRAFWAEEFPTVPAVRRTSVTNKLAPLVTHPVLGPIISARGWAIDADLAIRERKIVVVNLASGTPGTDVTTLLGTFLVQKVLAAAYRQGRLPPGERMRHVLVADEFQRFMHRAAGFDQILAEARKYRLSLVVANQYVEQLSDGVRAALFGNAGCLATFRAGHRDARVLAPEFAGADAEELMELGVGECLARIGSEWTRLKTPPPPQLREAPAALLRSPERVRRPLVLERGAQVRVARLLPGPRETGGTDLVR